MVFLRVNPSFLLRTSKLLKQLPETGPQGIVSPRGLHPCLKGQLFLVKPRKDNRAGDQSSSVEPRIFVNLS